MKIYDNFFQRLWQFLWSKFLGISPYNSIESYLKNSVALNEFDFLNNLYRYTTDNEFVVMDDYRPVFSTHPFYFFDTKRGSACDFALFFHYMVKYFRPGLTTYVVVAGNKEGKFIAFCFVKLMPCICFSLGTNGCVGPVPSLNEVLRGLMCDFNCYYVFDSMLNPLVINYSSLLREDL